MLLVSEYLLGLIYCAGYHRVPLCFCADTHLRSSFLLDGLVQMDSFEIYLVYLLHVLHNTILHSFRNDEYCSHTQPRLGLHNICPILYAMEPFQWPPHPLQGNVKLNIFMVFFWILMVLINILFLVTCVFSLHQRLPVWWRWYYWLNPVAWSLYGLLTSQYGDDNTLILLSDGINRKPIKKMLRDGLGFRHEFVGIAGIVVVGYCLFFAVIFAYAMKTFHFQTR